MSIGSKIVARRSSALYELSLANARELLRSGKTIFGVIFMFIFLLGIIVVIHISINVQRHEPVVGIVGSNSLNDQLLVALEKEGIEAREFDSTDDDSVTATVELQSNSALVTLDYPHPPAWLGLDRAIHELGIPTSNIAVIRTNGEFEVDILRLNLGAVLIAGLMAIVFLGTSVPLVSLRKRGTLRLLGTTPLSRLTFIISQSPVRFLIGVAEAAVIVVIAWVQGYVESFNLFRLAATLLIGLSMLFALAYLLASRSKSR